MNANHSATATVTSSDGTTIGYETLGSGDGLIVVGGVLRAARDYMDLARSLADSFTVHVMHRRGRGMSGPQGPDYSVEKECEDLLAMQAQTGAESAFGHSYGGFVALEAARRSSAFRQLAVYEPGIVLDGSPAPVWIEPYRELLAAGDPRGAFATMVKHAGFAPRALAAMPLAAVRLVLRAGIRSSEWQRTEALLEANLAEHQAQLDASGTAGYTEIASQTRLIRGSKSPALVATQLEALVQTIPNATVTILDGLDHLAPETHPVPVASCIKRLFAAAPNERSCDAVNADRRPADHAAVRP